MAIDEYAYDLPEEAIAQTPAKVRSAARLLVAVDADGAVEHRRVSDLADFVRYGDVIVVNETKVLPARLRLQKESGGAAEVLLLERRDEDRWIALVRPGRRLAPGTILSGVGGPIAVVEDHLDDGRRVVRILDAAAAEAEGELPLPPYITKPLDDPDRYQTVYAASPGSAAAPTAGLHLTPEVLAGCENAGAEIHRIDLAVGLDTFRPIAGDLDDHVMHSERYRVPEETWAACQRAERVIAVGTTATRALEAAASSGELSGRTTLFIRPGFDFRVVDVLLTNFHLPRSTLLVMLHAFAGERWRRLYEVALAEGYRFLSFGDAMLVAKQR
jgi:S-adenosylmethionine:tRNA ribosyltransferase-isomerase